MNSPECNVCHIDLDEDQHQPRHLGCSHDACTACVKALIKNGSLECPMCRQVVKADTPEDLKINHGVVQVLRMIKEFKVSEEKRKNEEEAAANNTQICRIHRHSLVIRCVSCKIWICVQCKDTHTQDIGCEVLDNKAYLDKLKEEHKQNVEPTLLSLRLNLKSFSSEISKIESEKKKLEENITSEISQFENEKKKLEEKLASVISQIKSEKKRGEEKQKKLLKVIDEGSKAINEIEAATADIEKASSSIELSQRVNISNDLQQFARIWCKKNPGSYLELLRSGEEVYATMDINSKICSGKVLLENGNMYLHCLRLNGDKDIKSSRIYPYDQVLTWLPAVRDLVFLDLAIAGVVQGRVTIHLRQDLTNYAKNIPLLFTGEEGHSLLNLGAGNAHSYAGHLGIVMSSVTRAMNKFTRDASAGFKVVQGSVLAYWKSNELCDLHIFFLQDQPYTASWEVLGQVTSGLDVVQLCRNHSNQRQVTVQECGLVFKEDALRGNTGTN